MKKDDLPPSEAGVSSLSPIEKKKQQQKEKLAKALQKNMARRKKASALHDESGLQE